MDGPKFRVLNPVREGILPLEVAALDSVTIPLKKLLEAIIQQDSLGLWLNPYRGIPWAPGLPKRDLVFLDENHCVMRDLEKFPSHEIKPFRKAEPASALVLPSHTMFASHVRAGDQLAFHPSEAMDGETECVAASVSADVAAQSAGSPAPQPRENASATLFVANNASAGKDADRKLEDDGNWWSDGEIRKDLFKDGLLRWFSHEAHDRRAAKRYRMPNLVAVQQDGARSYLVGNISDTGLFLLTEERISIGTTISFTLERRGASEAYAAVTVESETRVVRWGPDGVGAEFVPQTSRRTRILKTLTTAG